MPSSPTILAACDAGGSLAQIAARLGISVDDLAAAVASPPISTILAERTAAIERQALATARAFFSPALRKRPAYALLTSPTLRGRSPSSLLAPPS